MVHATRFGRAIALTVFTVVNAATLDLPIQVRNSYAVVQAEIGTPPSTYLLLFDTGSSSSWVDDQTCAVSCPNGSGYKRVGYNASASSTSVDLGAYGEIDYFGGLTGGPATSDVFTLNPSNSSAVTWNQTFLAASESSWTFAYADGFLGLAFSTIAAPETTTLVETMMQQDLLDDHRFGIYYGTEFSNSTGAAPGPVLTIGGSREAMYVDGDITYIPLRNETEFQVWRASVQSVTGTTAGTDGLPVTTVQPVADGRAVFDTGSGMIQVPTSMIDGLYTSIGFNYTTLLNGQLPLCSDFNSSWSFSLNFGQANLTLTGDQLLTSNLSPHSLNCLPPFSDSGTEGFFLMGTPWLRRFYTAWDFGAFDVANYQPRIGFGKLKAEFDS